MAITQLSVFLENRPGMLCDAIASIKDAGINIRALSVADTNDFGILRIIVSDTEKTKAVLSDAIIVKETSVIAVKMSDKSGALMTVLEILRDANVNIEYVYAFTGAAQGSAYVVLRVDELKEAEKILARHEITTLNDEDMSGFLA